MCQFETKVPTVFMDDKGYQITITVEAKDGAEITENTVLLLHGKPMKDGSYILENGTLTIIRRHVFGEYTWAY